MLQKEMHLAPQLLVIRVLYYIYVYSEGNFLIYIRNSYRVAQKFLFANLLHFIFTLCVSPFPNIGISFEPVERILVSDLLKNMLKEFY